MKKSEFLNKTKEELQEILDELEEMAEYYDDDDDENIKMVKLLLTNEAVLKSAAKNKEGREQLLVLAETTKGILGVLKMVEADFEDDINEEISDEDVLKSIVDDLSNNLDIDREDVEDAIREGIAEEAFDRMIRDTLVGDLSDDDEDDKGLN